MERIQRVFRNSTLTSVTVDTECGILSQMELLVRVSTGVEQSGFPRIKIEYFVGFMHQKSVGIPSLSACLVKMICAS